MNDVNQSVTTLQTHFDTKMQQVKHLCEYHLLPVQEALKGLNSAEKAAPWLFDESKRKKMVDEWPLDKTTKQCIMDSFTIPLSHLFSLKTSLQTFHLNAIGGNHNETELILNQAVVLMVAYFESSLRDLFKLGINDWFTQGGSFPDNMEEHQVKQLNFNLKEWWDLRQNPDSFFDRFSEKCRFVFHNMDQVAKAFAWLSIGLKAGVESTHLDVIKCIIERRHAIAHEGVPPKKTSGNRAKNDDSEKLTPLDVQLITDGMDAMTHVMHAVCKALRNKMSQNWQ